MDNVIMDRRHSALVVILFLTIVTVALFWQVRNHEFVILDDDKYVTENSHVRDGLTWEGLVWAFTTTHANFWHPLTWISHMLDCELYGLDSGGHHFTNLLIHLANTLLLFLVLERMTGAFWPSAFVAALFALHPLHVESVAWVAERKDVLSTFFCVLTMGSYVRYAERPGINRYLLVLLSFVLGLMAKPMLVTLPFVLLLLDYWPLGRFQFIQPSGNSHAQTQKSVRSNNHRSSFFRLVLEKLPFFALAAVSSIVAFLAQEHGGALRALNLFPIEVRMANAVISYASYIGKTIWPLHLAVFYPHPGMLPLWQVIGAGLFLVSTSVLVIRAAHRFPYLTVGWLWYLGTLVPVIGLVQVGDHAMADRYTYVPLIGLFIMIAWGSGDISKRWRYRRIVLPISTGVLLCASMISTGFQLRHWQNSTTLFEHALDVTADNTLAHTNLGIVFAGQGKLDEAVAHYAQALRIKPDHLEARINMGAALATQGRLDEAVAHYSDALYIKPDFAGAHYNLGNALVAQGKITEAIAHFHEALRIKPNDSEIHNNLGIVLAKQGKTEEAITHFHEALRITPDYTLARKNLEIAQGMQPKPR
jgi:tetratricopeptide (TPR) repeat protein